MANMEKIQPKLDILPAKAGCYLMKDVEGTIIYVGKAIKLSNRVRSYFRGVHNFKTTKLVQNIDDFEFIVCNSEKEALIMEINLIKEHTPKYNIMFMDDKSYPYIKLSKTKAPTLQVVRNNKDKKAYYFGPFPNSGAAYQTKDLLHSLYPLRKCKNMPKKACLYYHLGQCLAPCIHDVEAIVYERMAEEIRKFLRGDAKEMLQKLRKQMEVESEALNFEKAKEIHDVITSIEHTTQGQNVMFQDGKDRDVFGYYFDKGYICIQAFLIRNGKIIERSFAMNPIIEEVEDAFVSFVLQYYQRNPLPNEILLPPLHVKLEEHVSCSVHTPIRGDKKKLVDMVQENAKTYHEQKFEMVRRKENEKESALVQLSQLLHKDIKTIEIYDNSHISGKFNVSGMVVFEDGIPNKKEYRLYKLDTYRSDMDSMKEVVYRRYLRILKEQKKKNDLLIVDGGLLQIKAAKQSLDALYIDDVILCGLVKNDKHKTSSLMDSNGNIMDVKKDSPLFFLLTQMQDEVHRFAITYHKNLRKKAQTKSILDEVDGLGPVGVKKIWKHFSSLKKLKEASIEEIASVVSLQVAKNIYEVLHDTQI